MRIYNIFGRLARTHYRNRATASTACPQMPHVAQYTFLFGTNASAVLPSLPYVQSRLAANGSTSPYDRQKDRTFPHPEAHSRPLHGDTRLDCGTFSQNSPTFSEKRGEISKKSPIFYFHLSRHTFETAKKKSEISHKYIAIRIISNKTHHQ